MENETTESMQYLFVATNLDCFVDYSVPDLQENEYSALHIKGVCYQRLTPIYYVWLRNKIQTVNKLFKAGKITEQDKEEVFTSFDTIHTFAIENFQSEAIENNAHELLRDKNIFTPQVYNLKLETSPTHKAANSKQGNPYQQSNRLCPSCSPILNFVSVKETENLLQYNCFICNNYCSHEPKLTETEVAEITKKIDNFANVKPYCTIETIDNKTVYTYSSAIPSEQSEPLAGGNLSFSRSPSATGAPVAREGTAQLSDLSNLSWLEIVNILRAIDKNTKGQNRQVNALLGYYQPIREDRPNIGMEVGLLKFLNNCREIVRGLIQQGLYNIQESKG